MTLRFEKTIADGYASVSESFEAIEAFLEESNVPLVALNKVMICCDEIISNVIKYTSAPRAEQSTGLELSEQPTIELVIEVGSEVVCVEIADKGPPFNPLSLPEPDTSLSLEKREIGGLGVHIVRKLMEDVTYLRKDGWNRLRFSKTISLETDLARE